MFASTSFRRRTALVTALLCSALAQAAPPLPARNLSVEMRVVDDSTDTQRDARAAGTVTLGGTGRVDAAGAVAVRAGSQRGSGELQHRVLVLNGARATLQLTQGVPVDDVEVLWTPWGPGAALRTRWVELVNGMEVTPRWPGGSAPVTLDIAAQRATPGAQIGQAAPGAVPAQASMLSTLQVPLGEWVSVAQLQDRRAAVSSNGFDAATRTRQRSLQVRVSLP